MKYSVFTVMTPDIPVMEVPQVLKDFGYDAVEFRVKDMPKKPDVLPGLARLFWEYNESTLDITDIENQSVQAKKACDNANIDFFSLATYLDPSQYEEIDKVLKAAKKANAKTIRLFPHRFDDTMDYTTLLNEERAHLKVVEKMAKEVNIPVVLEQHNGTIIPSASAAYNLVKDSDPDYIGIILDAGNMVSEGYENYFLGTNLLNKYIHHVHLKDNAYNDQKKPQFCPIGQGLVNFENLFKALKKINYNGYLSFEDFSYAQPTKEKLKSNLAYIKSIAESIF